MQQQYKRIVPNRPQATQMFPPPPSPSKNQKAQKSIKKTQKKHSAQNPQQSPKKLIFLFYSMSEEENIEPTHIDPSKLNLRNKGVKTSFGRVHKGCVKDAFSKLSIGSIPSNYQSIIYKQNEKKGFGTQQKRFYKQNQSHQVLRGDCEEMEIEPPVEKSQASYSSKGYGPLIAKEKREWRKFPNSPGPCRYFDLNGKSQPRQDVKKRRTCFTREREVEKIREIAMNKQNQLNPGPGYYELQTHNQHGLLGWKSSFVTKDKREGYIPKNDGPGPGVYPAEVSKEEKSPKKELPEEELFSKLSRDKQVRQKHFLAKPKHPGQPGPGHYEVIEEPYFKPLYEKIKISPNFIQNSRDRFDDPIEQVRDPEDLGPTATTYDLPSPFDKSEKKLIEMSSFMSESKRAVFDGSPGQRQIVLRHSEGSSKKFPLQHMRALGVSERSDYFI